MPHKTDDELISEFKETPGGCVKRLILSLGIPVKMSSSLGDLSGQIQYGKKGFEIVINADQVETLQRFTAAHLLGHYHLHRDLMIREAQRHGGECTHDDILNNGPMVNPTEPFTRAHETQANMFAANLIMPGGLIEKNWDGSNVVEMADAFCVTAQAMRLRLHALKIKPIDQTMPRESSQPTSSLTPGM
jgi:Zn-dependent peptidase ImmA (M78 family)